MSDNKDYDFEKLVMEEKYETILNITSKHDNQKNRYWYLHSLNKLGKQDDFNLLYDDFMKIADHIYQPKIAKLKLLELMKEGDLDNASSIALEIIDNEMVDDLTKADYYNLLGRIRFRKGDYSLSLDYFEKSSQNH